MRKLKFYEVIQMDKKLETIYARRASLQVLLSNSFLWKKLSWHRKELIDFIQLNTSCKCVASTRRYTRSRSEYIFTPLIVLDMSSALTVLTSNYIEFFSYSYEIKLLKKEENGRNKHWETTGIQKVSSNCFIKFVQYQ